MTLLALLALLAGGCGAPAGSSQPTTNASATADLAAIRGTFGAYRAGVVAGAPGAVLEAVTPEAVAWFAEVGDLARTADAEAVRDLPATPQLLVLTLRAVAAPAQLQTLQGGEEVLTFLVEGGYAGQDRALGGLGEITLVDESLAVGVVTRQDNPTPLRWRFERAEETWRFDLLDAYRLNDDAIAGAARQSGQEVTEVVRQTLQRLTGQPVEDALYDPPPAAVGGG